MDINPKNAPVPLTVLRSTSIKDFQRCPRYGMFKWMLGIVPVAMQRKPALDIGTLLHAYMEDAVNYDTKPTSVQLTSKSRANQVLAKIIKRIKVKAKPEDQAGLLREAQQHQTLAWAMHQCFFEKYPWHGDDWKILATEQKVVIHVAGISRPIQGTLDLIPWHPTEGLWVEDYKSCRESPSERAETIRMEWQRFLYPIMATQWDWDRKRGHSNWSRVRLPENFDWPVCKGIIHDLIQKPSIMCCGKDEKAAAAGEFPDARTAYLKRVKDWYTGQGEYEKDADKLKTEQRMRRSWVKADPIPMPTVKGKRLVWPAEVLEPERYRTLQNYARMSRSKLPIALWERRESACRMYNSPCEYLPLCQSHPDAWPGKLDRYEPREEDE